MTLSGEGSSRPAGGSFEERVEKAARVLKAAGEDGLLWVGHDVIAVDAAGAVLTAAGVPELEQQRDELIEIMTDWQSRAEAAERRVAELAGALERIVPNLDGECADGNIFPQAALRIARDALSPGREGTG